MNILFGFRTIRNLLHTQSLSNNLVRIKEIGLQNNNTKKEQIQNRNMNNKQQELINKRMEKILKQKGNLCMTKRNGRIYVSVSKEQQKIFQRDAQNSNCNNNDDIITNRMQTLDLDIVNQGIDITLSLREFNKYFSQVIASLQQIRYSKFDIFKATQFQHNQITTLSCFIEDIHILKNQFISSQSQKQQKIHDSCIYQQEQEKQLQQNKSKEDLHFLLKQFQNLQLEKQINSLERLIEVYQEVQYKMMVMENNEIMIFLNPLEIAFEKLKEIYFDTLKLKMGMKVFCYNQGYRIESEENDKLERQLMQHGIQNVRVNNLNIEMSLKKDHFTNNSVLIYNLDCHNNTCFDQYSSKTSTFLIALDQYHTHTISFILYLGYIKFDMELQFKLSLISTINTFRIRIVKWLQNPHILCSFPYCYHIQIPSIYKDEKVYILSNRNCSNLSVEHLLVESFLLLKIIVCNKMDIQLQLFDSLQMYFIDLLFH